MLTLFLIMLSQAQSVPEASTQTPVSYVVSVVNHEGECLFLPTDVGLTASQLKIALEDYNRANGIVFTYYPNDPSKCVEIGRKAAIAAGFTNVTARPATVVDEGHGRVPR